MEPNKVDCQVLENEGNENQEINQVIPGYDSFHDYVQDTFDAIKSGIKSANGLPIDSNFNYYSCFPSFLRVKNKNAKLLSDIMQHLLGTVGMKSQMSHCDIEEKFELLLEVNDIFLDRANSLMDRECGINKDSEVELVVSRVTSQPINGGWNDQICRPRVTENSQAISLLAGKNVQRPQLMFKDKIDNSSNPWCPRIKDKPNSLKPLAIYLEEGEDGEVFNHPYEYELDMFVPSGDQFEKSEPIKYKSLEETPLIIVKDPSDIKLLIEDLKRYKEIAVDLEHHFYRSFQGITCLMQISTRDTDYLIDTLSLRSELHELNEIFTKRTILKVFHGADLDIQWLQRDLSLYVVNMFDTHQAAKQLYLPYLSLAYLLKRYCNVDPDKHFQMADWRIRPLPEKLMKYAREDTHYLLHIKDVLKNALIDIANGQINILEAVYNRSTEICKKTYIKPVWKEKSCMIMYRKSQKMFNNRQLYALKELHKWRDQTAREEDDSIAYVLPNHMLLNIAETLPREMQGILACCDSIPPLVRQNLLKLHKIILKAREQPLIKPIIEEDIRQRLTQRSSVNNSEVWVHSRHDIPSGMEARADSPCLLDENNTLEKLISNVTIEHTVTVFDSPATSEDEEMEKNEQKVPGKKKKFVFVSPFERYKRVIPMIAEEEAREREKQREEEENRLNELKKKEKELEESKNRVYEHFKQVSQIAAGDSISKLPRKSSQVPLSQMSGRKKKRDSNINKQDDTQKETVEDNSLNLITLETRNSYREKQESNETEDLREESITQNQKQIANNETVNLLRSRKKGEKDCIIKDLKKKDMMPSKAFDYKAVDFSTFQGGSKNTSNQTNFEQTMKRKKEKTRKRKKQKLSI